MSVTDPLEAPARSASPVMGQRNPSAAKIRHSPATTAAATAVRRSVRPVAPDHSRYATQDSTENQAAVWTPRISASRRPSTGGGTRRRSRTCRAKSATLGGGGVHRSGSGLVVVGGPRVGSMRVGIKGAPRDVAADQLCVLAANEWQIGQGGPSAGVRSAGRGQADRVDAHLPQARGN